MSHSLATRLRLSFSSLALLAAFLGANTGAAQAHQTASPVKVVVTAAQKRRVQVFEQVWGMVSSKYYDPKFNGINWKAMHDKYLPQAQKTADDAQLYDALDSMLDELHDAHMSVTSPQDLRQIEVGHETAVGLQLSILEHEVVVLSVVSGSEAARAGVLPGMIMRSIDEKPLSESLGQVRVSYADMFEGNAGTRLKLALSRADGTPLDVTLTRWNGSTLPPAFASRLLPSGAAYIKFEEFNESADKQIKAALQKFKDAPALVLDLRDNPGGSLLTELNITGYFFNDEVSIGRMVTRNGKRLSALLGLIKIPLEMTAGEAGRQLYSHPVVVLINHGSASAAESLANTLQEQERAYIVGTTSHGSLLGARMHKLRDGGQLEISEIGYLSAKGRIVEGHGVTHDKIALFTLADLQQGRDAALEAAEAYFAGLKKQPELIQTPK